jgi:hypothetical protein
MKVQVCSKSLLKEETYAQGKVRVSGCSSLIEWIKVFGASWKVFFD